MPGNLHIPNLFPFCYPLLWRCLSLPPPNYYNIFLSLSLSVDRLCGLVVRVPGYRTEMYCASCEVRTEFIYVEESDRLCDLVVRVLGYRSGGPGSVPGTTRFSED
jgi:hypothetical protein